MSSANASAVEGIGPYNRPGQMGMTRPSEMFVPLPDPISDAEPVKGVVPATNFAPPYKSRFLDMSPNLAHQLTHVNCSYLTTHNAVPGAANTAPSLVELKRHTQGLMVLIREMSVATSSGLLDVDGLERDRAGAGNATGPTAPAFEMTPSGPVYRSTGAFDFVNDLATPYVSRDPADLLPLTHLLNQLQTHRHPTEPEPHTRDICPLSSVTPLSLSADSAPAFRDGTQPLPHQQVERLMKHANEVLLLIDNALSASGGLLSALPLDLPADDLRRNSFLGQLIHFLRVLVARVHVLDRDYGQALDLLAGEATVPRELLLTPDAALESARDSRRQHQFILAPTRGAHAKLWDRLRADAEHRAVRDDGTGFLEVTLPTRFQAVRGGKTIFITPVVEEVPAREARGRPTVVACAKPGYEANVTEWEMRHRGELEAARGWEMRARAAEEENEQLRRDLASQEPEGTWLDGESAKVLDMWTRVGQREDALKEKLARVDLYAARIDVLERENGELAAKVRGRGKAGLVGREAKVELREREVREREMRVEQRRTKMQQRETAVELRETKVNHREIDVEHRDADLVATAAEARARADDSEAYIADARARLDALHPDAEGWTEVRVVEEMELLMKEVEMERARVVAAETELVRARAEAATARAEVERGRAEMARGRRIAPAPEEGGDVSGYE